QQLTQMEQERLQMQNELKELKEQSELRIDAERSYLKRMNARGADPRDLEKQRQVIVTFNNEVHKRETEMNAKINRLDDEIQRIKETIDPSKGLEKTRAALQTRLDELTEQSTLRIEAEKSALRRMRRGASTPNAIAKQIKVI